MSTYYSLRWLCDEKLPNWLESFKTLQIKVFKKKACESGFSSILQSSFFEKVCCLILASSEKKLHEWIEILKFDVTIKKIKYKLV